MNKQTHNTSQSLILAKIQGAIIFVVFFVFILALFFFSYLDYLHSKQRILSSFENTFSQRALALDASIGDIVNHVLRMKIIADDYLAQNIDDRLLNETFAGLEENSQYYPAKDYHSYHLGERLGQQIVNGAVFAKGSVKNADKEYIKRLFMSLSLLDTQKALHENNPNVTLSYFISRLHNFIECYPNLPINELANQFDDISQFIDDAYNVYDDFAPPEKNPEGKYFWTKPYLDRAGNGMMVTCGIPVYENEEYIGVLGADIVLQFLDKHVAPIEILPGRMMLVSEYRQIISAPGLLYKKEADVSLLEDLLSFEIDDPDYLKKGVGGFH